MGPRATVTGQIPTTISKEILKSAPDDKSIEFPDRQKYTCFLGEFETPLLWKKLMMILSIHLWTLYILFTHEYSKTPVLNIYCCLVGMISGFGVTGGAHRFFTHRAYKANRPLTAILLFCYSVAGQNNLIDWVRDHRVHHKYSETDADPHNSKRGFFFAHVGWLCMKKHPEVIRKGRLIDISDLYKDPMVGFYIKHFIWFKIVCCFILPTVLPMILWGESFKDSFLATAVVRYTFSLNFTWAVNSAAHMWGYKPYDKNIMPTENTFVSLVSFGEGWHNYHHTFPWDYKAAELNQYLNVTTLLLDFFARIGWAYDLKTASLEMVRKVAEKRGDGSPLVQEVKYKDCAQLTDI